MNSTEHVNPLRDPQDRRLPKVAGPCGMVIFGVTGDLSRKKLMPAVYDLANRGLLPPGFSLTGFARRDWAHQDFAQIVHDSVKQYARTEFREEVWRQLAEGFRFVPGNFDDDLAFDHLRRTIEELDQVRGAGGNHAFYLAIPPGFFGDVVGQLKEHGLAEPGSDSWRRVVVEKPFGHDLASARELNGMLDDVFPTGSVFRIDHYLGKETVQNMLVLRFANGIFEPLWNRSYIDHVQITAAEEMGIGSRAGYYDNAGALRDIVQNHLLQLLSILGMEPPVSFTADEVRDEKVKVLRAIEPPGPEDRGGLAAVRGQYTAGLIGGEEVSGYREEAGVPDDSRTETFVAMRLEVDNWRWAGIPFYLRAGKRLPRRTTEIAVTLKPVPHLAFSQGDSRGVQPNQLILSVQPDEGVSLSLVSKVPGARMEVRPVNMEFLYGTSFASQSPEAYERLILDTMRGDATLFARGDEVEAAWAVCDAVLRAWEQGEGPVHEYAAGSAGPAEANDLLLHGAQWREL